MNKLFGLMLLTSLLASSCQNDPKRTRLEKDTNIIEVETEDKEMNRAMEYARTHYYQFTQAALEGDTGRHDFRVKVGFPMAGGGREHIWISDLVIDKDSLFGYVANEPHNIPDLKPGQKVYVDTDNLSDWYYIENHKLVGGWTIKILFKHSSKEKIAQLEKDMGCTIDFRE